MSHPDPRERARENASGIAAILVTGLWLSLMFAGFKYWLPLMLFGYIVVVPLVGILFDDDEESEWVEDVRADAMRGETAAEDDEDAALAKLRERYANGELTDEQFERKVERLLETDTLENVEDRKRERRGERETEFE